MEGEGGLHVAVRDGVVTEVALNIFEPPRFFEAFLRGRRHTEAPDITARICGICPVAYQMSACNAMEDACGVSVGPGIEALRRLLYCGEYIQSHALHVYLLHAPDFFDCEDAVELAGLDAAAVERGLALKRTGNLLMETVGGRAVHPVNVRVGGFYRAPDRAVIRALAEPLRRAATRRSRLSSGSQGSTSPTWSATTSSFPFAAQIAIPSSRVGWSPPRGSTPRWRGSPSSRWKSTCSARTPCTRSSVARRSTSRGPSAVCTELRCPARDSAPGCNSRWARTRVS